MIDTSTWKEFCVGELFSCETTLGIPSKNDLEDGNINYITRSAADNGFSGTCGNEDQRNKGNCITIGAEGFVAFWQNDDFVAGNKVYALRHPNMNEINGLFVCSALNALSDRYSFADARVLDKIKVEIIKLPATSDGQPDWDYMESYMKAIMEESENNLENLRKADNTKHLIDVSGWKRFHLYDDSMFGIDMGTKMDKAKMKEVHPTINFVGRANANNGITTCVDRIDDIEPYPSGYMTLSLGGEYLGSCFIQPKPFYTSQNVIVLIPNDNMTDNIKRFIATMIFRESRSKYKAFVDELNRHIKTDFSVLLPITPTGEPDWQYMEDYMRRIMDKSEQIVSELQKVV